MKRALAVLLFPYAAVGLSVACGLRAPTANQGGSGSGSTAENYTLNIEGAEVDIALASAESLMA